MNDKEILNKPSDLKDFNELAKSLAINYYNCSLGTSNPDDLDKTSNIPGNRSASTNSARIERIFKEDVLKNKASNSEAKYPFGFSRNILIIGAGASKNAYDKMLTALAFIPILWRDLGILKLILKEDILINKSDYGKINIESKKEINDFTNSFKLISKIKLKDILADTEIANSIIRECFHYLRRNEDRELTLNDLFGLMEMEGSLFILQRFVNKNKISQTFKKYLNYSFIPNLFYELAAHFFKHQFIDVIINLNFDELLDNALEDEMGESEWIKIYDEATSSRLYEAIVDNRLKKPLYIKPHGTISDVNSLLFSVSEYIEQSDAIKSLLDQVFMGRVNDDPCPKSLTRRFNIIITGYSLNDIDIREVIINNILKNRTSISNTEYPDLSYKDSTFTNDPAASSSEHSVFNTKIYLFDPEPHKAMFSLENHFQENQGMDEAYNNRQKANRDKVINFLEHNIECYKTSYDKKDKENLDYVLYHLLCSIQNMFDAPFCPSGPERHLFNYQMLHECSDLFHSKSQQKYNYLSSPKDILKDEYRSSNNSSSDRSEKKLLDGTQPIPIARLLLSRTIGNLVFEILKHSGFLPFNVITSNRVGKYYQLWLDKYQKFNTNEIIEFWADVYQISTSSIEGKKQPYSIFDILDESFSVEDICSKNNVKRTETHYHIVPFYNKCFINLEDSYNVWEKLDLMVSKYIGKPRNGKSLRDLDFLNNKYLEEVIYSSFHEINPHYKSKKYLRFHPVDSSHILNTNLALTWFFYDFTILKQDTWDQLIVVTSTGNAIANLAKHQATEQKTHLEKLFENNQQRKIKLLHTFKNPVFNINNKKNEKREFVDLYTFFSKKIPEAYHHNFLFRRCKLKNTFHKVALYLKNGVPVHAIYFINPPNKNRINPIWFSTSEDLIYKKEDREKNKRNMEIVMAELLPHNYDKDEEYFNLKNPPQRNIK